MYGFVYLWMDSGRHSESHPGRRMFVVGSHWGTENDGYVTSTGGTRFWNAYRKRSEDFKRRIIARIYENNIAAVRAVEQRWLDLIKALELGVRYYNISKSANGFDHESAVKNGLLNGKAAHQIKLPDGRSVHAIRMGLAGGKAVHKEKLPDGRSANAVKIGLMGNEVAHAEKLPDGKSALAVKMGLAANTEKLSDGRSVNAVKRGLLGGPIGGKAVHSIKLPDGKSAHAVKIHSMKLPDGRSVHAIAMGKASALARKNRKLAENPNPPPFSDRSSSQTLEILQTAEEGSGLISAEP